MKTTGVWARLVLIAGLVLAASACQSVGDGTPTDGVPDNGGDVEESSYQPIEPMEDITDPQPATIDDVRPSEDGMSLKVRYQNAYAPCSGARVTVTETSDTVTVLLETGLNPNAAAMTCLAGITGYEQTVGLEASVGDREIVFG